MNLNVKTRLLDAPSIFVQCTVFGMLILVITAIIAWQDVGGTSGYPVEKLSMTPLPDKVLTMDFNSAEDTWSSLELDSQGNIEVNSLTVTSLSGLLDLSSDQSGLLESERMEFLLAKQFGKDTSQQFLTLLPTLKKYTELEKNWLQEHGSKLPPPHEDLFRLQDELFGEELAQVMFFDQRKLMRMMQATFRINNDNSLTQEEKNLALLELQAAFRQELPNE